ncbi:2-aminoethanethiol dioxygenase [Phytophthora cinnamomi]|uniref:2-aminoethanethiol dioxygenase n=1 Tax=Phytophthora cinnamomi TaxID=4785 RepID=UPI00355AC68C|nr:2-aminoethanethiol dioxygenase [Phytophthora cinnamomi]
MDLLNSVWRMSVGGNKELAAGQQALESIQQLLVAAIAQSDGAPHALTAAEIAPIEAICDQLFPANFQLKVPGTDAGEPERPKRVHYQHVYEDETFSIGIFILPPGVAIPLHDHPGMSVISRLLYGSLHIRSYDLVKGGDGAATATAAVAGKKQTARLHVDEVLTAPHTTELLPDCGNLHQLVGGDDIGCAFLDIITPPYDSTNGRDCTYYRVLDSADSHDDNNGHKLVTLETFNPLDFDVVTEPYFGPRLQRYVS